MGVIQSFHFLLSRIYGQQEANYSMNLTRFASG